MPLLGPRIPSGPPRPVFGLWDTSARLSSLPAPEPSRTLPCRRWRSPPGGAHCTVGLRFCRLLLFQDGWLLVWVPAALRSPAKASDRVPSQALARPALPHGQRAFLDALHRRAGLSPAHLRVLLSDLHPTPTPGATSRAAQAACSSSSSSSQDPVSSSFLWPRTVERGEASLHPQPFPLPTRV